MILDGWECWIELTLRRGAPRITALAQELFGPDLDLAALDHEQIRAVASAARRRWGIRVRTKQLLLFGGSREILN